MKKGVFKPAHTVHVQYQAHQEVPAIVDSKGRTFVLYPTEVTLEGGSEEDDAPLRKTTSPAAEAKEAPKAKKEAVSAAYTEKELIEKDVKELEAICKSLGIDPSKTEGRNTNKKLRLLILENGGGAVEEAEEPEAETPKSRRGATASKESLVDKAELSKIVKDLDVAEITDTKAIQKVCDLGDVDKKAVTKVIEEMMANADLPLTEVVENLEALFTGESKPTKGKKSDEPEPVEWGTLEKGDVVKVLWKEEDEFFSGKVASVTAKGILIKYDDGEEEFLDEEYHSDVFIK